MSKTREFIIESPKYGKHTVLIDEEDWERVSQHKWRLHASNRKNEFYAKTEVRHLESHQHQRRKTLMLHRLIMDPPSGFIVDHRNHNGLDNRKENLRICTMQENLQNRRANKNSKCGYKGVERVGNRYRASIHVNGIKRSLGRYDTPEEAARAYDAKAIELFGEYAHLNLPEEHNRKDSE